MTGLTPTAVLRFLNSRLGTVVQDLEISEEEMMRVVFQESLYTYSKYFPYKYNIILKHEDLDTFDKRKNIYKIPNKDNMEIFGIHKVFLSAMETYGTMVTPISINPFSSQIQRDAFSQTITPTTWEFLPPNRIEIKPKITFSSAATVVVKAIHPKHLKTINQGMRDEFMLLCLYDVLLSLYPIRHRFQSMSTPFGNIEPFFEMVDSAADKREELLRKWRENFLNDGTAKRIWIA